MRVLQILLLTFGLIISATILSRVSAQNSNSNTAANSNYAANRSNSNKYFGNLRPIKEVLPLANTDLSPISEDETETSFILKQISKQKPVEFPKQGELKVQIIEEISQPFTIRFVNDDGEKVAQFLMRNPNGGYVREYWDSAVDPKAVFKVIEIEGVPSPLIHLAMVQPGGSDHGFWSAIFGEINGKIKLLTPFTTRFSIEGGIQIGDLGKGNGTGIAVWNSVWGDGEPHYGEHFYQVDFYNFNRKLGKFIKTKQIKTKQKYESSTKALASLGLGFYKDAVGDFPEFLQYREDF